MKKSFTSSSIFAITIMVMQFVAIGVADTLQAQDNQFRDPGFGNDVLALGDYNSDLIAGGKFFTADSNTAVRIARWDGSNWRTVKDFVTDAPENDENRLPDNFELSQNYPNLFKPTTRISFTL